MLFKDIASIAELFLLSSLTIPDIEGRMGPVVDDSNPSRLTLSPTVQSVNNAELGQVDEGDGPILSYLFLDFNPALPIPLSQFVERYGVFNEGVRLKPADPIPYSFNLKNTEFWVQLTIHYAEEDQQNIHELQIERLESYTK